MRRCFKHDMINLKNNTHPQNKYFVKYFTRENTESLRKAAFKILYSLP